MNKDVIQNQKLKINLKQGLNSNMLWTTRS